MIIIVKSPCIRGGFFMFLGLTIPCIYEVTKFLCYSHKAFLSIKRLYIELILPKKQKKRRPKPPFFNMLNYLLINSAKYLTVLTNWLT